MHKTVKATMPSNHELIEALMNDLLGPEYRRFSNWIDQLCKRNQEARGDVSTGFLYEGRYYKPSNVHVTPEVKKYPLHVSLQSEMDVLIRDRAVIDIDSSLIKQSFFKLLYPCTDGQQLRDALPEMVVPLVPYLQQYKRENLEAWTIQDDPRAMKQYNKVLSRIEMYVAARMIY